MVLFWPLAAGHWSPAASSITAWEEFVQDSDRIVTWPVRWDPAREWYVLPLGAGGCGVATQDLAWAEQVRKEQNPTLNRLADVGNFLGDGYVGLSAMALLMSFGGEHDRRVGQSGVLAFLEAGMVTQVIKNLTGRLRPSVSPNDPGRWGGPALGSFAFPSGHVTTAAAFSTVVASAYPWGWVCYAIPPLVGWARMYSDQHWASDVYFGFLVGWGVATLQVPRVQWASSPVKLSWRRWDQMELKWSVEF